jgi:HKD family nuclease/KaiC/GvpD/RAD55 family RecA-like ATPase
MMTDVPDLPPPAATGACPRCGRSGVGVYDLTGPDGEAHRGCAGCLARLIEPATVAAVEYRDTAFSDEADQSVLAWLQRRLPSAAEFTARIGYLTAAGIKLIEAELTELLARGGRFNVVAGAGADQVPDDDLRYLVDLLANYPDTTSVVLVDGRKRRLHSKSYLIVDVQGSRHGLVGSGNLTYPGLVGNIEAAVALHAPAGAESPALDRLTTAGATPREAPDPIAVTLATLPEVLRAPYRTDTEPARGRRSRTRLLLAEPSRRLEDTLRDTFERAAEPRAGGVPFGFRDLDDLTRGLHPGQLALIAARPGTGKSVLAMDVARSAAIRHHLPTIVFSLEMSSAELSQRIIAAEAKVLLHQLRAGTLSEDDWSKIARRSGEIADAPLFVNDSAYVSLESLRAEAARVREQHGLALLVIDYLQLMLPPRRTDNRQQEVSDLSRGLKLLAKELEVPVLAVSQLNRGPEQRQDRRPLLADLRESGGLEQDSDLVLMIHREDMYERESPRAGEADLLLVKHRNGPTATTTVAFQGHFARFMDMAPH